MRTIFVFLGKPTILRKASTDNLADLLISLNVRGSYRIVFAFFLNIELALEQPHDNGPGFSGGPLRGRHFFPVKLIAIHSHAL